MARDAAAFSSARSGRRGIGSPRRGETGHALLTALLAMACLLPLGAFAAMQARLDFQLQHAIRRATELFRVAEAGLESALADLDTDPRFDRLLLGPDRLPGTGDDGEYPFVRPPPSFFPQAPFRYEVRVLAANADQVDVVARAFDDRGGAHALEASVVRAALPYFPAAVAAGAPAVDLSLGAEFHVDGDGSGAPALAVARDDAAASVRARLAPDAAARLGGCAQPPCIAVRGIPDVAAMLDAATRRVDARPLTGTVGGAIGDGLFVSSGPLRLTDLTGSGVLLVGGALDLDGTTSFSGVIAVAGALHVADGATATLTGAVVQGVDGAVLRLLGAGQIAYDAAVLERVDRDFPGLLQHRARVTGWREAPDAGVS